MTIPIKLQNNHEEIFLDILVDEILQLQIMQDGKSKFLGLSVDYQDDYLLDVLSRVLKINKLSEEKLYVITRENAFQYQRKKEIVGGRKVYRLSNTRYTIPAFDLEERVPDDMPTTGKPVEPAVEEPTFSGVGSFEELLRHWRDGYKGKPFRVLFFDGESKGLFDAVASAYQFTPITRPAPLHTPRGLNIYLYHKH